MEKSIEQKLKDIKEVIEQLTNTAYFFYDKAEKNEQVILDMNRIIMEKKQEIETIKMEKQKLEDKIDNFAMKQEQSSLILDEYIELKKKLDNKEEELDCKETKLKDDEKKIMKLSKDLYGQREKLENKEKENNNMITEIENLKNKLSNEEEENNQLKQEIRKLKDSNDDNYKILLNNIRRFYGSDEGSKNAFIKKLQEDLDKFDKELDSSDTVIKQNTVNESGKENELESTELNNEDVINKIKI